MGARPTRAPRWGYGGVSGALVEPSAAIASSGFPARYEPPAQWINYLIHYALAWTDHLRGPGWGAWTRAAHGSTAFTAVAGLAVDIDDSRASAQAYRYAVVGAQSGPAPLIATSRNGLAWTDRDAPTSFTGTFRGIACCGDVWVLWGTGTSQTWTTPADTGANNSAVRTGTAGHWTTLAEASGYRVGGAAWNGADEIHLVDRLGVTATTGIRSLNGGSTWGVTTLVDWGAAYLGADIAYDDSRSVYVISSSVGGIARYSTATGSEGPVATLSGVAADADVRLRVGGPEDARTLLAWASYRHDGTTALTATQLWRSTDGGDSWTAITLPEAMRESSSAAIVTDVCHVDGTWVATTTTAPYFWRSDDDGQNWERIPLPIAEESSWALSRAVYADGQIVATGLTWTVYSSRASATSPGTWTSREPSYLADAGYLRGRRIHTTAPTDGQVYAWNSGTSQWEPVSASAITVTTTRGDLIRRGASADERLAVGASGRYLRSDGTDPSWAQVQAADLTGAPWSSIVPPTTVETNDATETTLATIATIASRSYAVDLVVASTRSPTAVVVWKLLATVHSDGGGTLTLNDVLVHGPTDGGASGMAATVDVSGTDIRVRVTGLVASVVWSVTGTVLALEN